ncbi:helix-turn-helix domain-containing protein [Pseudomonas extremaustralis]|uniref:Helix-turn-helix domain-containing protein n=1 Tax=Pseudomonas extremaustralis TaxID=359110 RepID=A0A5C5QPC1_9PSED|nr:helix-turn-helix domain-containing protein [Pseudomonas extremaustralis]EZI30166.1 AraC family transcriptional regulator [Pseudomonas extremaustralis 14-3 substr. 14-3b]MDB1111116.1 helix-turn-helix domain-containing protein [Pseudomonas extremaustralis]MDF3136037.1 helix-turn-helix domain-containing protein [Pseudomonas extremaustralis]MDG2965517.1 helix-turn-helix domain-containing protein [Pseudomonas extremaustralis]TWS07453.1 helix-turn-helix domain-containing protein [Pseudomonas extr
MPDIAHAEDSQQTQATGDLVLRHHLCWRHRDLDGVMAYYHPAIQYHDFFQNRVIGHAELREYLKASMPRAADEAIEHIDRIRADGDTAFIQYRITLRGSQGLVSFRTSEAITVRDGLIWRVNEYASLVHEQATQSLRPTVSRLGLSPQQLGHMANDLQQYFELKQPYLDPELDLQRVAKECGYSRNQISYLLNQVLGQSFYRYVNQARLQHLLAALDTAVPPIKVDELAFAAGFNSLSAFYSAFRQHTGQSPKAYVKQISLRARAQDSP